jgi:signal transduction histidine kinase
MEQTPRAMLVVETDPSRRIRIAERLSKHNVSVLLAGDLSTAQSIVRRNRVAAVVVDAHAEDHGSIRERLCMHGLDVDTPFLVLDESTTIEPSVLAMMEQCSSSAQSAAGLGTMSAGSQTSLLYALPHEYRTPLTDIIGQSAFLHGHATKMTSDEIRDSSTDILRSARRLLRITDSFLLFAQLEMLCESPFHVQRMRQASTPCAGSVISDALHERISAYARENDIICTNMCNGISVRVLPQYLSNIITELVDNACAFSMQGSPIHVSLDWDERAFIVAITDSGIGMSAEECASVGPYRQFCRSTREQQGVGLGLTIAQRLTELHGGALTIKSVPHVGTTVTVTLPRADVNIGFHPALSVSAPPRQMAVAYA